MPQGGGVRGCKELREASMVTWWAKGLSTTDLATLWARYGSVLPALRLVSLLDNAGATAAQPAPMACSGWRRGWARARSPSRDLPPPHSLQFSIGFELHLAVIYKISKIHTTSLSSLQEGAQEKAVAHAMRHSTAQHRRSIGLGGMRQGPRRAHVALLLAETL